MNKYVVTGFNEHYWHRWGASWVASLKEFGKHPLDKTIVVGYDLTPITKSKLADAGVKVFPGLSHGNFRNDTLDAIADFARKEDGVYAYWDADAYFQDDISEVFDLAKENLIVSSSLNPGFLAGPHFQWAYVGDIQNIMHFVGDEPKTHECLINHFGKFVNKVDDSWNCVDMPHLKNVGGNLTYKGVTQKVIHPSGPIKMFLTSRDILFWERHKETFQRFTERKKNSSRKLVVKSKLHTQ